MGSSDLQIVFLMFIFVVLLCVLGSFFVFSNNSVEMTEFTEVALPYHEGVLVGVNSTTGDSTKDTGGTDWWSVIAGIGTVIATIAVAIVFPPAGVLAGIAIFSGIGVGTLATAKGVFGYEALAGLPVIGDILAGLSYVSTAIKSFVGLMIWGPTALSGFPIFLVLIGIPLGFFFFVFVIRFIRGQG